MSQDPKLAAEKRSNRWLWAAVVLLVVGVGADLLTAPGWVMVPLWAGFFFAAGRSYHWRGFADGLRANPIIRESPERTSA